MLNGLLFMLIVNMYLWLMEHTCLNFFPFQKAIRMTIKKVLMCESTETKGLVMNDIGNKRGQLIAELEERLRQAAPKSCRDECL